jgi:transcriptional regulator with XRE-family HTH domain
LTLHPEGEIVMNPKDILAISLKKEREKLGLSLKDVTAKLDFPNYQTLRSIETGDREIKAWELAKLAKIYGRDIDFFLSGKESREESKILWRSPGETSERKDIGIKFPDFTLIYVHYVYRGARDSLFSGFPLGLCSA